MSNQIKDYISLKPIAERFKEVAIVDNCSGARLMTYADNLNMFTGAARTIYTSMCDVWHSIGESAEKDLIDTLYDDTYITMLADKYDATDTTKVETVTITEENKEEIVDAVALLQKSASVNFIINTAKFSDSTEATQKLDEFIAIAKVLDGTIIEIAGNTDPNPVSDPEDKANQMLSQQRAETVKQYFILNGISPDRIITVGNGSSNPVVKNDTEEHRAMNRRTDVSFKCIE